MSEQILSALENDAQEANLKASDYIGLDDTMDAYWQGFRNGVLRARQVVAGDDQ